MYKEHPACSPPDDDDARIWRFTGLTKLLSLLDKEALFFSRVAELGDPSEGRYSRPAEEGQQDERRRREVMKERLTRVRGEALWMQYSAHARQGPPEVDFLRVMTCVNCWHRSAHESAAMWRQYARHGRGVAVPTSYKRLRESFSTCPADVHLGAVDYIDYEADQIPWRRNLMYPLLHKQKSFEHERELRARVTDLRTMPDHVIAGTGAADKVLHGTPRGEAFRSAAIGAVAKPQANPLSLEALRQPLGHLPQGTPSGSCGVRCVLATRRSWLASWPTAASR